MPAPPLSDYEQERLRNIQRNQQALASLGLADAAATMKVANKNFNTTLARHGRDSVLLGNPKMVFNGATFHVTDVRIPPVAAYSIFRYTATVRVTDTTLLSTLESLLSNEQLVLATLITLGGSTPHAIAAAVDNSTSYTEVQYDCAGRIPALPSPWIHVTMSSKLSWTPAVYDDCYVCSPGGGQSMCSDCTGKRRWHM